MNTLPVDFTLTKRAFSADQIRGWAWALVVALAITLGWLAWFVFAQVGVYEVSTAARVEFQSGAAGGHPVDAPVEGLIVKIDIAVGQEVQAGDVLLEMDATSQRFALAEAAAGRDALKNQIDALQDEREMQLRSLVEWRESTEIALAEAGAKRDEAKAAVEYAENNAAHLTELRELGSATEQELGLAISQREQRRFAAVAAGLGVERLAKEQRTRLAERQGALETLQREATRLEGERQRALATIDRLTHEVGLRVVRAPVGGVIGETAPLTTGMYVQTGKRLATVLPHEPLRARARFTPASALGRIKKGQKARMRLEGFPWSQYGSVPATVHRVAGEMRNGFVEVEFELNTDVNPGVVFQHGLPGTVEVEVERISPATMLLRAVGRRMGLDQPAAQPVSPEGRT